MDTAIGVESGTITGCTAGGLEGGRGRDPISLVRRARRRVVAVLPAARDEPQQAAGSRRVVLLISAMAIMGLVDLMMTLTYMRSTGMYEMNPIARFIARLGAGEHLIAFKLLTMLISGYALYLGRLTRRGELCAWVCAAVLVGLMFHWAAYAREAMDMTNELFLLAEYGDEFNGGAWVRLAQQQ